MKNSSVQKNPCFSFHTAKKSVKKKLNIYMHALFSKVTEDFGQAASPCVVEGRVTFSTLIRTSLFSPLTIEGCRGKSYRSADRHMLA